MTALIEQRTTKMTDLDKFLEETARSSHKGLRLHEFVLKALHHGFRGEERGELTRNIHRALKRMVRNGVLRHHDLENPVEFVA